MAEVMVIGGHDLRLAHKRCCSFLLTLSLESHSIVGSQLHVVRTLSRHPIWRSGVRNWSILSTASKKLPTAMWVCHPGCRSFSPSQAFRWLQSCLISWIQPHERFWAKTIQLTHSWISDSQKLWDNKSLLLYTTKFEGNLLCSNS